MYKHKRVVTECQSDKKIEHHFRVQLWTKTAGWLKICEGGLSLSEKAMSTNFDEANAEHDDGAVDLVEFVTLETMPTKRTSIVAGNNPSLLGALQPPRPAKDPDRNPPQKSPRIVLTGRLTDGNMRI